MKSKDAENYNGERKKSIIVTEDYSIVVQFSDSTLISLSFPLLSDLKKKNKEAPDIIVRNNETIFPVDYQSSFAVVVAGMKIMNANLETPVKINQFLKDTLKNGKNIFHRTKRNYLKL